MMVKNVLEGQPTAAMMVAAGCRRSIRRGGGEGVKRGRGGGEGGGGLKAG